jgi:hypothetical protein
MNTLAKALKYISLMALIGLLLFGAYWLAKHGSYWLWYEDMVKDTIVEMVKQEALK